MSEGNGRTAPENKESDIAESQPAVPSNKGLTIDRSRLAGSLNCLNCGTELQGPFCHYCGQPDKNLVRFFPALLRDMLEDFADFDSRFVRTLKPLLFKPGKLTRDYLDGRRFRYVPPLRLYIFSSLALFFVLTVFAANNLVFETQPDSDEGNIVLNLNDEDPGELREALSELDQVQPGLADRVSEQIEQAQEEAERLPEENGEPPREMQFDVDGKPWHPETNPLDFAWLPDWVNRRLNEEIAASHQKEEAIKRNPNLIMENMLDVLPGTMFVLLPLVALLLKFWYLFARRYYVEHLIFALHNHAFVFVTFMLTILVTTLAGWFEPSKDGPVSQAASWLETALWIWIPVYLFVSLKRVYQQGWWLTTVKYLAIGTSYLMVLVTASFFAAAVAFIMI